MFWGNQYSVMQVSPVGLGGAPASSTEGGTSALLWIGAGVLIVAIGAVLLMRRRGRDETFYA